MRLVGVVEGNLDLPDLLEVALCAHGSHYNRSVVGSHAFNRKKLIESHLHTG